MNEFYEKYKNKNQIQINQEFHNACDRGNLDAVRYLLTSPELDIHAEIDGQRTNGETGLLIACIVGHLEIVKYLLTSSELSQHADIHIQDDRVFFCVLFYDKIDIASYLIFDFNISKTKTIQELLLSDPNEKINQMFSLRELNQKHLEVDNINKSNIVKKAKV